MLQKSFLAKAALTLAGFALVAGAPFIAMAQEEGGTKTAHELRADYNKAVEGKTIAFLPIALGVPLQDEWERVVRTEAAWRGMKYVVRDPNNNPSAMQQALTALVNDKPDVLIVQNPSVTLLMKELKRAEAQGTHVIQVNMSSNYKSDAFVGADWYEVGRLLAEDVVKQCGAGSGKSGKVSIVQGELTAAASVDQIGGIMDTFKKDPSIKVVSNQAANWDANAALNITSTVIQQNPDLCASIGFWGIMESGAAQAIRNAGKIDQVKVYASGEGSQLDCDQVNQGNFYKFLSYKATEQGHDLISAAVTLLEENQKPGEKHLEYYTQPIWLDKTNANGGNCFALPKTAATSPVPMAPTTRSSKVDRDFRRAAGVVHRAGGSCPLKECVDVGQHHGHRLRHAVAGQPVAAALAFGTAAEAVVRAGDPLHLDDRVAALVLRDNSQLCRNGEFSFADAALRRVRLRRPRHGVLPDHRRHRSQRRRHLRALQFHRPVPAQRRRAAGSGWSSSARWRSARQSAASTAC